MTVRESTPEDARAAARLGEEAVVEERADEHGYPTMITDRRVTNVAASRFRPRRGFRETFLRVYRSIP